MIGCTILNQHQVDHMEVHVKGKNDKLSSKEIKYALEIFGNVLLGKRLAKNVSIDVVNEPMNKNFCGFCEATDHGYRNHRFFEITINCRQSKSMQIRTLAHEMVHVMQFARNELKFLDKDNTYKWRGKVMRIKSEKYFSMPWEMEAHISEDYLIAYYKNHLKENKVKKFK